MIGEPLLYLVCFVAGFVIGTMGYSYLRTAGRKSRSDVDIAIVTKSSPVQIEGRAYGKRVYFREWNGHWQFGYGRTKKEAIESYTCGGECDEFMDPEVALEMTRSLISLYLKERS